MIRSIKISNFQSHRNTELDLHPGVNALVGSSDAGKTAILRALSWVVNNRPSGDSMRSSWGGETRVELTIDDGLPMGDLHVRRIKGDGKNAYEADMAEFKAMGQGVPEPVVKALNLGPINVQDQHDAPFLLSSSPGEVARMLNGVVGLEDIDTSLANANRAVRQAGQDLERERAALEAAEAELAGFDGLDALGAECVALEADQAAANRLRAAESTLNQAVAAVEEARERLALLPPVEALGSRLAVLLEMDGDADRLNERINGLHDLINSAEVNARNLKVHARIAALAPEAETLAMDQRTAQELRGRFGALDAGIRDADFVSAAVAKVAGQLSGLEAKFKKEFPKECPLCGAAVGSGEMTPIQERAALSAARKLGMIGSELNEHGAIDLCHGFMTELRK